MWSFFSCEATEVLLWTFAHCVVFMFRGYSHISLIKDISDLSGVLVKIKVVC